MRSKILAILALTSLAALLSTTAADAQAEGPVPPFGSATASAPEAVPTGNIALTGVASTATGYYHGCAVMTNTQVRCWGYNVVGELGNDYASQSIAGPVIVVNVAGTGRLSGVTDLALGEYHSCALLSNHQVRCWGYNREGQLGDGTDDEHHRPVTVRNAAGTGPLTGVAQITAADATTCALLLDGRVRCWGDNSSGQFGAGISAAETSALPVPVLAPTGTGQLGGVTQIDAGPDTMCARLANGQARCWGYNSDGQLGDGSTDDRYRPVAVRNGGDTGPLVNVGRISAGEYHSCALITNGTARCWGYNGNGQLGDGSEDDRELPAAVRNASDSGPLRGITYLDAGAYHSCALLASGGVRCWGENDYGEVGNSTEDYEDVLLPAAVRNTGDNGNLAGVAQLQASDYHTCVRLENGQARCWGYGQFGGLGNYSEADSVIPVKVLSGVAG